ncbi:hypothetical protein D9756_010840 [Leucocoprinus leucothites]|uniref:glutathione-specific gamma-glutamylcyclotransferase n=1 Tax=Leucocoprinus leucothites TaxID=201217 RepID=A0A8H5FRF4_9AGAR|nr:hypothetical protein D9756_010840 [Leucoagaricus leucothites]
MVSAPALPFVVFGYGSLIFKARCPPPHVIAQGTRIRARPIIIVERQSNESPGLQFPDTSKAIGAKLFPGRIAQNLICVQNPGRVVTLVHKEDWDRFSGSDAFPDEDVVWGIAYTIDPVYEAEVRDYLDYREKDGYTMETLDIHSVIDGKEQTIIHNAFCYVGRNDNPSFIGSEPLDILADRIWRTVGPSGPNKEYLFKLANSVRELSPDSYDSHLFALEDMVKALDGQLSKESA